MVRENLTRVSIVPKDTKWHQGRFHPQHPEKYQGDADNIIYRSSWELHFFQWCDRNDSVLKYAAEEFSIPYVNPVDGRVHRYYPDALVEMKRPNGEIKKYLIEIKPKRQCAPPTKPASGKTTKTYINEVKTWAKNEAKWKYAAEFCKDNGVEFKILTEDDLGIKPYGKRRNSKTRRLPKKR